jgi:hypothetical protein
MENQVVPRVMCGAVLATSMVSVCKQFSVDKVCIAGIVTSKNYENILQWSDAYQRFTTGPALIPENFQLIQPNVEIAGLYEWKFRDPTDLIHTVVASEHMYTIVNREFVQMKYISSAAVIVDGNGKFCKIVSKTPYSPKISDMFYAIRMQDMTGIVINNLILGA